MGNVRFPLIDKITGKISPAVIPDLSGDYVPGLATPPDHTVTPVYADTSTVPPVVKGWNGTAWVAIGGGGGTSLTDNGDGTWTATSGVTDNGDGTWTA